MQLETIFKRKTLRIIEVEQGTRCVPIPFGKTTLKMFTLLDRQEVGPKPVRLTKNINRKTIDLVNHIAAKAPEPFCKKKSILVV